jgi:hypothetical protein
MGLVGRTGLDSAGIIGFVDLGGLSLIGIIGIGLVGFSTLADCWIISLSGIGVIGCFSGLSLVDFIGIIGISLVGIGDFVRISFVSIGGLISHLGLVSYNGLGINGISLVDIGVFGVNGLISLVGIGFFGVDDLSVGLISLVGSGFISLVGRIGLNGLIGLIGLVGLVGFGLNGLIGVSIIAFSLGLVRIQFKIELKQYRYYLFVRESWLWCVRRETFDSLITLWPDFCFEKALQNAKQLFFNRLQQMTKYFVMRECENIPTWISLCVTTVFSQQGGISVFKFPKRFSSISWAKSSLYLLSWLHSLC